MTDSSQDQGDFVPIPKSLLDNMEISWGAKGVYTSIAALPDPANFKVEDLPRRGSSLTQIREWVEELRKWGYLPDARSS